ncbi:MAG TPA: hypothetical protein VFQ48_00900, partial [Pseudonocardiaceae bacterium]|nr:hypothetical protein [Pseudonocardiaceae bacterium]
FGEASKYLAGLIAKGKLTSHETIIDCLENAIEAHNLLSTPAATPGSYCSRWPRPPTRSTRTVTTVWLRWP